MHSNQNPTKVSLMSGAGEQESLEAHHSAPEVCDMLVQVINPLQSHCQDFKINHHLFKDHYDPNLCAGDEATQTNMQPKPL